jgi:predicted nucleic acid-binding protein
MVLVDSSIWIKANRHDSPLETKVTLQELLKSYQAAWCGVVKLEVLAQVSRDKRGPLAAYFSVIPYLTITERVWESARILCWKLKDNGLTIPMGDALIAALAIEHDCRVFSADAHFTEIAKQVPLRLYEPGYGGSYAEE